MLPGTKVKYSDTWINKWKRSKYSKTNRYGTISTKQTINKNAAYVLWDGNKAPELISTVWLSKV